MCAICLTKTIAGYYDNTSVLQHLLAIQPLACLTNLLGLLESALRQLNGGECIQGSINGGAAHTFKLVQDLSIPSCLRMSRCSTQQTAMQTCNVQGRLPPPLCGLQHPLGTMQQPMGNNAGAWVQQEKTMCQDGRGMLQGKTSKLLQFLAALRNSNMSRFAVCRSTLSDGRYTIVKHAIPSSAGAYPLNHLSTPLQRAKQAISFLLIQWV